MHGRWQTPGQTVGAGLGAAACQLLPAPTSQPCKCGPPGPLFAEQAGLQLQPVRHNDLNYRIKWRSSAFCPAQKPALPTRARSRRRVWRRAEDQAGLQPAGAGRCRRMRDRAPLVDAVDHRHSHWQRPARDAARKLPRTSHGRQHGGTRAAGAVDGGGPADGRRRPRRQRADPRGARALQRRRGDRHQRRLAVAAAGTGKRQLQRRRADGGAAGRAERQRVAGHAEARRHLHPARPGHHHRR